MKISSYIEQILSQNEQVLYVGKVSHWSLLFHYIFTVLLFPFGLLFLAIAIIRIKTTELAITNKKVIAKTGFIQRSTIEILLHKVESIQVHQSILGRLLNYGSIIVSGAGNPQAPIRGISSPLQFRKKCMEIQERVENNGTPKSIKKEFESTPPPPSPEPSIESREDKAIRLKAKGKKLLKNGDHMEAIAALNSAINNNPSDSNILFLRAVAYSKVKDKKNMLSDLKEAAFLGNQDAKQQLQKLNGR